MDRWGQDDLGPRQPAGKVARLGLGGFTKSSVGYGASASEPVTRIEVVASKTEQKQQQQQQAQPSSPARPPAPAWAGHPPPHSSLSVLKEGTVIQNLPLSRPATLFGRVATADVICDHGSLSRQHAQLCYKPATRQWLVVDLGSTHGTFVDGHRLPKATPIELSATSSLRFGASTRTYALQQPASSGHSAASAEPAPARAHVHFADSSNDAAALEQVIGYSDSKDFAVNIGPASMKGTEPGRFAAAVSAPQTIAAKASQNADQVDGLPVKRAGRGDNAAQEDRKRQRKPQPLLPSISSGLYDMLPATSHAEHAA